jgi:hypothetical protein
VKELRYVAASQLQPNPKNWRTHPEGQQNALRGILAEIGFASAVLARETPEGGLRLIDGHLRTETMGDALVPVLVLDVNEAEADKLLATIDPLGAMAEADTDKLRALLEEVETASEDLANMFIELAEEAGILDGESIDAKPAEQSDADRDYIASTVRQVVLVFDQEQYEMVLNAMGEHAEKFALSNNTEVIIHLLETNGYAVNPSRETQD